MAGLNPQTFAEKIFGAPEGAIVFRRPDIVLTHDNTVSIKKTFEKMGGKKVFDPGQLLVVLDHNASPTSSRLANDYQEIRRFVQAEGIASFYDAAVTGTYIIAVVITAPAMIKLGVPEYAAHMFVFYYAVLAEVTPPTALSAFAAAAITGGDPYKTTMMSWKYTLPAFLVPFMFTIHPNGVGLLLKGSWTNIILTNFTALIGVGSLAAGMSGWLIRKASLVEGLLLITAGLTLVYPTQKADFWGTGLVAAVALWEWRTRRQA
mgnify:CR=1 FL=1